MAAPVKAIALDGLTKDFRFDWRSAPVRAVDQVSFDVPAGQVVGLLGPNGCGKSTTLKLIVGLLAPTRGRCLVWGGSPEHAAVRQRVGYLPEPLPLHRHLSGEELVRLHGRLAGVPAGQLRERVHEILRAVGLETAVRRRVATYSTGMLRRVGLAAALVHEPDLLVLDEPTAGVDPQGVEAMLELIRAQKSAGRTVLIASHLLTQVESVCDRVVLLHRGRLLAAEETRTLVGAVDRHAVVVDELAEADQVALRQWLEGRGCTLHGIERPQVRLDQVFLREMKDREAASCR